MTPSPARALPPLPIHQSWLMPLLRQAARWSPATAQRHHVIAQDFFDQGSFWEAEKRWQWVLGLRPTHVQASLGLAEIWLHNNRIKDAITLLQRVLMLQPKHPEARFLLAQATGSTQPPELLPLTFPPRLLQRRYAPYAEVLDILKLAGEGYHAPSDCARLLLENLSPRPPKLRVLDIGCGSGLLGELMWRVQPHLEGVDSVRAMVTQARKLNRLTEAQRQRRAELEALNDHNDEFKLPPDLATPRPVYDALWNEDVRDFLLRSRAASFHAIIASEVFVEIGGLTPVFDGVAKSLLPGGLLVCSTDTGPQAGYMPQGTAVRFAHSEVYLNQQAQRVGLEVIAHLPGTRNRTDAVRYSIFRKPVA